MGINNVYSEFTVFLGGFGCMLIKMYKDGRIFRKFIGLFLFVNC